MDTNDKGGKLSNSPDRISDLPDSIIECILSRLPLREVVRTSILSTIWRLHWTKVPELILNKQFVMHLLKTKYEPFNEYADEEIPEMSKVFKYVTTVSRMLLVHGEPIHKFVLHIPFSTLPPDANLWIHSVSRKGVEDLTLDSNLDHFKVPSYVYHCTELKRFRLVGFELCPSRSFMGFSHLLSLELVEVELTGDTVSTLISGCPLLESVSLDQIYGKWATSVIAISVSAPKLKNFFLQSFRFVNVTFTRTPELTIVSYGFHETVILPTYIRLPNIVQFFGSVSKIEDLTLSGNVLTELGRNEVPERLLAPLVDLGCLTLLKLKMCTLDNLLTTFCILKSSPNLQKLNALVQIQLAQGEKDAVDFLEAQQRAAFSLYSLKTIKIKELLGRPQEILLIKILLSSCPILEMMHLFTRCHLSDDAYSKMLENVMRLPRASTRAEIIYSRSAADDSAYDF